jgi:hypothetical protein
VLVRIESQRFYRDPPKFRGLHDAICKACATHEQRKQATEIVACTGCGFKIYHPPYNGQILMRRGMGLQNTTLVDDFTCSERCYRRRLIIRQAQRVKIRVCEVDKKEFKTRAKRALLFPRLPAVGFPDATKNGWINRPCRTRQPRGAIGDARLRSPEVRPAAPSRRWKIVGRDGRSDPRSVRPRKSGLSPWIPESTTPPGASF